MKNATIESDHVTESEDILGDVSLVAMLEKMMLIRRFEEATIKGYQQKKIAGFLHTNIGQEAVCVGTMSVKQPQDSVTASYRSHGLGLAMDMNPDECMAELHGKVTGCARGKGGSMHFFDKEKNFLGGHGIVGGQFGPGIGTAFAMNYKNTNGVAFIHFGDGAAAQGTVHETMNLAALWKLPAIFIAEDNQYGMGTATKRAIANPAFSRMGSYYGIPGYVIDGMNLKEVYEKTRAIVEEVRKTKTPAVIHMKTYRFKGHSISDAGLYRSKEEVKKWQERDPIGILSKDLVDRGVLTEEKVKEMDKAIKARILKSVEFAEQSPEPPMEELKMHTYADTEVKAWQ